MPDESQNVWASHEQRMDDRAVEYATYVVFAVIMVLAVLSLLIVQAITS